MSYWYMEGADGLHYCYAKEPTFVCPIGSGSELDELHTQAAETAGYDPAFLLRRLNHSAYRKRDEKGRMTDRCQACGAKLERLGYAFWTEDPSTSRGGIAERLGLGLSMGVRVGPTRYADTKREAKQWAVEQCKIALNIKQEEERDA